MGADQEGRKGASSIFRDQKKGQKRAGVKRRKNIHCSQQPFHARYTITNGCRFPLNRSKKERLKEDFFFSHYVWHSLKLSQIVRLLQGKECSRGILIPDVPASFFSHLSLSPLLFHSQCGNKGGPVGVTPWAWAGVSTQTKSDDATTTTTAYNPHFACQNWMEFVAIKNSFSFSSSRCYMKLTGPQQLEPQPKTTANNAIKTFFHGTR